MPRKKTLKGNVLIKCLSLVRIFNFKIDLTNCTNERVHLFTPIYVNLLIYTHYKRLFRPQFSSNLNKSLFSKLCPAKFNLHNTYAWIQS